MCVVGSVSTRSAELSTVTEVVAAPIFRLTFTSTGTRGSHIDILLRVLKSRGGRGQMIVVVRNVIELERSLRVRFRALLVMGNRVQNRDRGALDRRSRRVQNRALDGARSRLPITQRAATERQNYARETARTSLVILRF